MPNGVKLYVFGARDEVKHGRFCSVADLGEGPPGGGGQAHPLGQ